MNNLKFSAGLWIFGPIPDRYLPSGYQDTVEIEERLKNLASIACVEGVELPYGPVVTLDNLDFIESTLVKNKLQASSIAVNVTGNRKWALGSLTNPDKAVREDAVKLISDSMKAAKALKAETVNLWMGQEGFDYPFEADYRELWKQLVEGLKQCAKSCPEVKLSIEYKRMEPRARCIPNSASQSLLLAQETGEANVGVTIDFGHALMGGENASQSALMLQSYNKLFHLHMNDNYGDWDWDMAAGYNNWWQLVEFCYWMKEIDFKPWMVLDIFPYRGDVKKISELSFKAINKAFSIAEKIDPKIIRQGFDNRFAIDTLSSLMD